MGSLCASDGYLCGFDGLRLVLLGSSDGFFLCMCVFVVLCFDDL